MQYHLTPVRMAIIKTKQKQKDENKNKNKDLSKFKELVVIVSPELNDFIEESPREELKTQETPGSRRCEPRRATVSRPRPVHTPSAPCNSVTTFGRQQGKQRIWKKNRLSHMS